MPTAPLTTPSRPLLRVTDLGVRLPTGPRTSVEAVTAVSLEVHGGQRVGIVGESGSGKSVTVRAIAGLLPEVRGVQVSGSISIDGVEMTAAAPRQWRQLRRQRLGMIFQDPLSFLNPIMRVGAQVREAIPEARARADAHLEALRLAGFDDPQAVAAGFPHELSGGMRQRVLIAIAIARTPDLLIADEPTTALDATVQRRVLDTLDHSVRELGTSLLLVSHDLAVVAAMTDIVYVMYRGSVVEAGAVADVLHRPRHPYTQALVESVASITSPGRALFAITASMRSGWADAPPQLHAGLREGHDAP